MADPCFAAILVAAGRGERAGGGAVPKQFRCLAGLPMLAHPARALERHRRAGPMVAVAPPALVEAAAELLGPGWRVVAGGDSRQASVALGVQALGGLVDGQTPVLVHDAARPWLCPAIIDAVLEALAGADGAAPALAMADSLRQGSRAESRGRSREGLWRVQTPQAFRLDMLARAHAAAAPGATDDLALVEAVGGRVTLVKGDERLMKVTSAQDFPLAEAWAPVVPVTGQGFDVHGFGPGDHLWLCGVRIPHDHALVGHSDADVGLHALTDALLGALGAGDIGQHFPPSDPRWKGADSATFLAHAIGLVGEAGGRLVHADVTLVCEAPRVGPHRPAMLARLAELCRPFTPRLSVKATTTEALGFTGRREGIAALAVASLLLPA